MLKVASAYKKIFENNGINVQLMPLQPGSKMPIAKFQNGIYKDDEILADPNKWNTDSIAWMVDEQLVCLDIDGNGSTDDEKRQSSDKYFNQFTEMGLDGAWVEKTNKGYHIIFKKPSSLKHITKHIDAFKHIGMPGIDLITESKHKEGSLPTPSVLCTYPSPNKKWINEFNPLKGAELGYPPEPLVDFLLAAENARQPKSLEGVQKQRPKITVRTRRKGVGTDIECKELIKILSELPPKYYQLVNDGGDHELWKKVMFGVQHVMGDKGYPEWVKFNSRATGYDNETVHTKNKERFWDKHIDIIHETPITMGSFRYWIRQDNPDAWQSIKKYTIQGAIDTAAESGDYYDIAQLCQLVVDDVIFDTKYHQWFKFSNGLWVADYNKLSVDINEQVRPIIITQINTYKVEINALKKAIESLDQNSDDAVEKLEQQIQTKSIMVKSLTNITKKIGNEPLRIIKQMEAILSRACQFDENPYLLALSDGWVIEFHPTPVSAPVSASVSAQSWHIRVAEKDDMLSKHCNVSKSQLDDIKDEHIKELNHMIEMILPIKPVRDFVLQQFALMLNGLPSKYFMTMIGIGANGKSTLLGLIWDTLGSYCINVDTSLYTRPLKSSTGPRPELMALKGARGILATEPGQGETIQADSIKKMVGGDMIQCRNHHQSTMTEFFINGFNIMLTNYLLNFSGLDHGICRRIVNIEFPAKFVANPDPKDKLQYAMDSKYRSPEWISTMKPVMLKLLLDRYPDKESLMDPPKEIQTSTNKWFNDANPLKQFIENELEFPDSDCPGATPSADGIPISIRDIWDQFEAKHYKSMKSVDKRKYNRKYCVSELLKCDEYLAVYLNNNKDPQSFILSYDRKDPRTPVNDRPNALVL